MFDFKFDWREDLNTGVEDIDLQHKQLFRIGRDIEQLLMIRCIGVQDKQLLEIVCALREFVAYHFYEEEQLMKQYHYSNIDEHVRQHNLFQSYIQNINMPRLKEKPYEELSKLKENITDWIYQHMLIEDNSLIQEIRNQK